MARQGLDRHGWRGSAGMAQLAKLGPARTGMAGRGVAGADMARCERWGSSVFVQLRSGKDRQARIVQARSDMVCLAGYGSLQMGSAEYGLAGVARKRLGASRHG
jgi:hypothetical protein